MIQQKGRMHGALCKTSSYWDYYLVAAKAILRRWNTSVTIASVMNPKVVEPDKLDTGKCQKEGHCED
jgi:hypothetical protein